MKLSEWAEFKGMKIIDISRDLRYQYSYIHAISRGKRKPGKKLACLISEYTRGKVTVEDLGYKEKERCVCPTCGKIR